MPDKRNIYTRVYQKLKNAKNNSVAEYITGASFNIMGNRELFAEGNIKVEKYTDTEIVLMVNKMRVAVSGRGLCMCFYNKHTVKINGFITGIGFDEA